MPVALGVDHRAVGEDARLVGRHRTVRQRLLAAGDPVPVGVLLPQHRAAGRLGERPTDGVPEEAQGGVRRVALRAAPRAPEARPAEGDAAEGGDGAAGLVPLVAHRQAAVRAVRPGDGGVGGLVPGGQQEAGGGQGAGPDLALGLGGIVQGGGEGRDQLLQGRDDVVVQLLQEGALDGGEVGGCTHRW
jgi:hypothetical protein